MTLNEALQIAAHPSAKTVTYARKHEALKLLGRVAGRSVVVANMGGGMIRTWCSSNAHMLEVLAPLDIVIAWEEYRTRSQTSEVEP